MGSILERFFFFTPPRRAGLEAEEADEVDEEEEAEETDEEIEAATGKEVAEDIAEDMARDVTDEEVTKREEVTEVSPVREEEEVADGEISIGDIETLGLE